MLGIFFLKSTLFLKLFLDFRNQVSYRRLNNTHFMALGKAISLQNFLPQFQSLPDWSGLTGDQKSFARDFFLGENVFITGSAGVGKSFIVNLLSKFLLSKGVAMAKTGNIF